jgi:hypothetical protein
MGLSGAINTGQASIVKGHDVTTPSTDYRLIPLTQGQFAKVDAADYATLVQRKWWARYAKNTRSFYALSKSMGRTIYMHRELLGLPMGDTRHGDHINGDTLDNRRSVNLRILTPKQNRINSVVRRDNKSGLIGVRRCLDCDRWMARVSIGGKRRSLGNFLTAEEAHAAYLKAIRDAHGEDALTTEKRGMVSAALDTHFGGRA